MSSEGTLPLEVQAVEPISPSAESPSSGTSARSHIQSLFNKDFKVVLLDDRVVIGTFLCTDGDQNIILGAAKEYENEMDFAHGSRGPRLIGLAMVNGRNLKALFVGDVDSRNVH